MLLTICEACVDGIHARHTPVIQAPSEGMLGGSGCRCQGECLDGRYFKPVCEAILLRAITQPGTVSKELRRGAMLVLTDLENQEHKRR